MELAMVIVLTLASITLGYNLRPRWEAAWRWLGRRRHQRRTEAWLREYQKEHSRPTIMGRWLPKSERPPFTGPEEDGAASSRSTPGTPPTQRRF
jgi:hypothetical protein